MKRLRLASFNPPSSPWCNLTSVLARLLQYAYICNIGMDDPTILLWSVVDVSKQLRRNLESNLSGKPRQNRNNGCRFTRIIDPRSPLTCSHCSHLSDTERGVIFMSERSGRYVGIDEHKQKHHEKGSHRQILIEDPRYIRTQHNVDE